MAKKQMVADVPAFVTKLAKALKKKGKANVDIQNEANGNADMAENFLAIAAREAGVDVDVKASKVSAIAIVTDNSDNGDDSK